MQLHIVMTDPATLAALSDDELVDQLSQTAFELGQVDNPKSHFVKQIRSLKPVREALKSELLLRLKKAKREI